jgi:hypothetical protein
MTSSQMKRLQANTNALLRLLADLANERALKELIKEYRRPGWTTPAEFLLVSSIVDSMSAQAKTLTGLRDNLLRGSRAIAGG